MDDREEVNTYGMGGAKFHQIHKSDGDRSDNTYRLNVSTDVYGEVREGKTQTALAANWTHSQDAAIIQKWAYSYPHAFYAVHDCGYTAAGNVRQMVQSLVHSYTSVVCSDVYQKLPSYNKVDLEPLTQGDVKPTEFLKTNYAFA